MRLENNEVFHRESHVYEWQFPVKDFGDFLGACLADAREVFAPLGHGSWKGRATRTNDHLQLVAICQREWPSPRPLNPRLPSLLSNGKNLQLESGREPACNGFEGCPEQPQSTV